MRNLFTIHKTQTVIGVLLVVALLILGACAPASTPTFTPMPTPPETQEIFLEITSVTSPINRGADATLTAKTSPNADCSITIYYKSGPSKAQGLYSRKADSSGNVWWTWKVGTRTTPGSWQIVVRASLGGETISKTTYFTVISTSTVTPPSTEPPAGVTAICNDGTYSYSKHRSGTCSHHGGVKVWINRPPN